MIRKYNFNSKKIIFVLGVIYIVLNGVLAKLFEQTMIAKQLLSTPEMNELLNNTPYLLFAVAIVLMALLTTLLMAFLYRNLLKFFFTESESWKTINFCYLISVIAGAILAIVVLGLNKNIDMSDIGKMTNLVTVVFINLLFYLLNRNPKEQLLVLFISVLNASAVFFL
jgi:hypothetical protein